MKIIIAIAFTALILSGCNSRMTTVINQTNFVAVTAPDNLFNCPQIKRSDIPNPDTATNKQVSKFIAKLYKYNKICGISIRKIKEFNARITKAIEERNEEVARNLSKR